MNVRFSFDVIVLEFWILGIYEALAGDSCALENAGAYIKLAGNNAHRNLIYSWVVSCYVPIKF